MNIAIQWSGPLLVCGAVLLGLAIVAASLRASVGQLLSPEVAALLLLSAAFLLPSLPGIYVAQAQAAGTMGLVAYVLLEVGILGLNRATDRGSGTSDPRVERARSDCPKDRRARSACRRAR